MSDYSTPKTYQELEAENARLVERLKHSAYTAIQTQLRKAQDENARLIELVSPMLGNFYSHGSATTYICHECKDTTPVSEWLTSRNHAGDCNVGKLEKLTVFRPKVSV